MAGSLAVSDSWNRILEYVPFGHFVQSERLSFERNRWRCTGRDAQEASSGVAIAPSSVLFSTVCLERPVDPVASDFVNNS